MPSLSEKDRANLTAILKSTTKILVFTGKKNSADKLYEDEVVYDATLMNFVVIGESAAKLSSSIKSRHPKIEWQKIKDFRNLITHDYQSIDPERAWQIIRKHLPQLKRDISALLKSYS